MIDKITELLGSEADSLLNYKAKFPKEQLHLPGPDFVNEVLVQSDRSVNVLKNLNWILNRGRLEGTGYVSILPVDQGIEHSGGASFAPNPIYQKAAISIFRNLILRNSRSGIRPQFDIGFWRLHFQSFNFLDTQKY